MKKLPSEVLSMNLPQVYRLFTYWNDNPPEHEIGAIFLRVYTTWKQVNELSDPVLHRKSLEKRWASGYMNIKQMFDAAGGPSGFAAVKPGDMPPGVGPFPGMTPIGQAATLH